MPIPPHDHDDGQFAALDEAQIDGTRVILALIAVAYTATIFALGFWAGGL